MLLERRTLLLLTLLLGLAYSGPSTASELIRIGGVTACDAPIAVVVHGINPTPGELDPLAENLALRGFRTYRFDYAFQERLEVSSRQLGAALRGVIRQSDTDRVLVVGYSMGGLIARRALTSGHVARIGQRQVTLDLVTIASPLGGFRSANWSWLSLGFGPRSHRDLGTQSRFIREPGELAANVRHTKIETIEKGSLRLEDGHWIDDDVVGLENQVHPVVDEQAARVNRLKVGHTSVVNVYGYVHPRLVDLLDRVLPERSIAALVAASDLDAQRSATANP